MAKTKGIVLCAIFTALTCVMTMVVQIPITVSGYVNLGDAFVLLEAVLLGPIYGTIAAGIGSALADVITGYFIFAPGTLIIKAGMAVASYFIYYGLKKFIKNYLPCSIITSIINEIIMVAGYFVYSALFMGEGLSAAASIPANLLQALMAVVAFNIFMSILVPTKLFDKLTVVKLNKVEGDKETEKVETVEAEEVSDEKAEEIKADETVEATEVKVANNEGKAENKENTESK